MSNVASAGRYARALLDIAAKESDPVAAERELSAYAQLFQAHPELRRVLTNPAVPVPNKRAVIEKLTALVKPSKPVAKLMLLLAERDRLELLPDLVAVYRERLMEHQGVVRAEVVTAAPLPDDRAAQLRKALAEVTGRTVEVTTRVDPTLIGGVVARIGSTVYDGSVATQLSKMREKLVEQQ